MTFLKNLQFVAGPEANVSPARKLDVVVGELEDGWPNYQTVVAGETVIAAPTTGNMYRVAGFTKAGHLVLTQHGLQRDAALRSLIIDPATSDFEIVV